MSVDSMIEAVASKYGLESLEALTFATVCEEGKRSGQLTRDNKIVLEGWFHRLMDREL